MTTQAQPHRDGIQLDANLIEAAKAPVGPVSIEGPPQSGKTLALHARAAISAVSTAPPRTFLLSPSERRARQIKGEFPRNAPLLIHRISQEQIDAVVQGTISGLAEALLRRFGPHTLGIANDFVAWDQLQVRDCLRELVKDGRGPRTITDSDIPDIIRWDTYTRCRMMEADISGVPQSWHDLMEVFRQEKRRRHVLDRQDVLGKAIESMKTDPKLVNQWRERIRPHLLVDDFQMVTPLEYTLLRQTTGVNGSITVAGDRNQTISSWWGPHVNVIERFKRDNAKTRNFTLPTPHDTTEALYEFVRQLSRQESMSPIPLRPPRFGGLPQGDRPILVEHRHNLQQLDNTLVRNMEDRQRNGCPFDEMAILARRYSSVTRIAQVLLNRRIPARVLADGPRQGLDTLPNGVTLSTFHASLGQHWRHVVIIDAADDIIPGRMATMDAERLAEEHNLFYLALTRASESLIVAYNAEGGVHRATRFVDPVRHLMNVIL